MNNSYISNTYNFHIRSSTKTYGLWKQIRVDHGREFYLLLYVQEALRCRVGPRDILPYVQSPSTEVRVLILLTCINFSLYRTTLLNALFWVEVNSRINYPLKRHLISMEATNLINMSDETTKFCVSFVTCNVAYHGLSLFVAAWNHHSIPGKCNDIIIDDTCAIIICDTGRGVPNHLQVQRYETIPIPDGEVPGTDEAADAYRSQGGQLREFGLFGCDPLFHSRIDRI